MFTCIESAPTWEENTQELTSKPIIISAPARNPMKEPLMRKRGFFGVVVLPFGVEDSAGVSELARFAGFVEPRWSVVFVEFAWFAWFVGFAEGVSLFKGCSIEVPILNLFRNRKELNR